MGLYMTQKDGFLGTWMTRDTVEEVTTPFIIAKQKMCVNVFTKYASVENRQAGYNQTENFCFSGEMVFKDIHNFCVGGSQWSDKPIHSKRVYDIIIKIMSDRYRQFL